MIETTDTVPTADTGRTQTWQSVFETSHTFTRDSEDMLSKSFEEIRGVLLQSKPVITCGR